MKHLNKIVFFSHGEHKWMTIIIKNDNSEWQFFGKSVFPSNVNF